ncbi:MAG: NnrS family protein [Rhizobiaceae bacterium]|nr:NnrS family protein [Rhizobiaceae bacterium]
MRHVLDQGFRPFFLLAGLWGGLTVPLWLASHAGHIAIAPIYGDRNWHAHELLFGYAATAVAGFLLTAIPNWTGRLPVRGWPLAALVGIWVAGRAAMLSTAVIGLLAAAVVDLAFLATLIVIALREIIRGRNWRNLIVIAFVILLFIANALFHASVISGASADLALRLAIATLVMLIVLIGGRIVPSFTRNWLVKRGAKLPAVFGTVDRIAMAVSVPALIVWVVQPFGVPASILSGVASMALTVRLARWRGWATAQEPLLLVLHLGYLFVPLGFFAIAAAPWLGSPHGTVVHLWTVGAIGTMTLAVMTRASLGHTGRVLTASPVTTGLYAAMIGAALVRAVAPLTPFYTELLLLSATAWSAALIGFVFAFWRVLTGPRAVTA